METTSSNTDDPFQLQYQFPSPALMVDAHELTPPAAPPETLVRAVRKTPAKPWRRPELLPPRVYHVEPRGFRRLVQRLTGAPRPTPRPRPRPLKERITTPLPLDLEAHRRPSITPETGTVEDMIMLSPTLLSAWYALPMPSPGTAAALELISNATLL
ncbi:hypothetical protein AXF42_Ash003153 [Apostasia shenzhenica]|uniref:VQ domain-containing protein n=1 Tax=Apostasia shenzhenica TaxID=1088818 RepID=A0A2I0BFD5_9ASPA|nr:hypothetical protein AXF42_Ash003153 [Apostasia shenzhenica]